MYGEQSTTQQEYKEECMNERTKERTGADREAREVYDIRNRKKPISTQVVVR